MNNILDIVRTLYPNLKNINETPIISKENEILGYNSTLYDTNNFAISGGTSSSKETARRIAVAEALERGLVKKISIDPLISKRFLLNEISSSLGFACGFEREKTKLRSFCEGIEKWALSQAIDFQYPLHLQSNYQTTMLAEKLCEKFDSIQLYQKKIEINLPEVVIKTPLVFSLLIGYTNTGAFPGSLVSFEHDDQVTHAAIEAYRNFCNYNYLKRQNSIAENLILKRILYFGDNKEIAIKQIDTKKNKEWPIPKLRLLLEYNTELDNIFLFRTLFDGFTPLNTGEVSRFAI